MTARRNVRMTHGSLVRFIMQFRPQKQERHRNRVRMIHIIGYLIEIAIPVANLR